MGLDYSSSHGYINKDIYPISRTNRWFSPEIKQEETTVYSENKKCSSSLIRVVKGIDLYFLIPVSRMVHVFFF